MKPGSPVMIPRSLQPSPGTSSARFHRRNAPRMTWRSTFDARFEHCAASPRPTFSLVYGPAPEEEPETALTSEEPAFEPLDGNLIDIGEAVAQELSLALPIFPRDPEARIDEAAMAEPLEGPFAMLARVRKDTEC